MHFGLCALLVAVLLACGCKPGSPVKAPGAIENKIDRSLNAELLESVFRKWDQPIENKIPPNDGYGTTENILYQGKLVMRARNERPHCIGILFQTYWQALERSANAGTGNLRIESIPLNKFKTFRRSFYGADGNKETFTATLPAYGLAEKVRHVDAIPGDLIQVWRNNGTGHCGVLLRLDLDSNGNPLQVTYWGMQERYGLRATTDLFGKNPNELRVDAFYICRARKFPVP